MTKKIIRSRLEIVRWLRSNMLVHSYLYYKLDTAIISDEKWQDMADQLARLQSKFGTEWGFYDDQFADWSGTTGMHLEADSWVVGKATQLLKYQK